MTTSDNHDAFDTFLAFEQMAHDRNENPKIADYPELVQDTLRKFLSLWMLPDATIPDKKRKSQHERWIKELSRLNEIAGSRIGNALELAHVRYKQGKPFFVTSPAAINRLLTTTVSEMNEEKKKKDEQLDNAPKYPTQAKVRKTLNILKD